jgi:hypothetical protein
LLAKCFLQKQSEIDGERILMYHDALETYGDAAVVGAGKAIIKRETFFPVPATYVAYAEQVTRDQRLADGSWRKIAFGSPTTPCEHAWVDLCEQRDNADVERVIAALGGWEEAGKRQLTYKQFTALYQGIVGKGAVDGSLPEAVGTTEE